MVSHFCYPNDFLPFLVFFGVIRTWFYSVPPLRFKSRLWLSNISIAFARKFLTNIVVWLGSNPLQTLIPCVIAISLFIYFIGAVSLKNYSDIEGDRTYGVLNLPIYYDEKKYYDCWRFF